MKPNLVNTVSLNLCQNGHRNNVSSLLLFSGSTGIITTFMKEVNAVNHFATLNYANPCNGSNQSKSCDGSMYERRLIAALWAI